MTKRKYKRGRRIATVAQFEKLVSKGHYIYYRHKPQHHGWMISMQYRSIQQAIKRGLLFIAEPNQ